MIKVRLSKEKIIKLQRGNKTISRSELDYGSNKKMYDFRGLASVKRSYEMSIFIGKRFVFA